jgi:hypothetical protein
MRAHKRSQLSCACPGLPIIPEIVTSSVHSIDSNAYKAFYAVRLLRLLRVARLLRVRRALACHAMPCQNWAAGTPCLSAVRFAVAGY